MTETEVPEAELIEADESTGNVVETDGDAPDLTRAAGVVGFVVRGIVDQPDAVKVSIDLDQAKPRVNVEVGPGDMGRVIGKRGRVANAIRAIGRAAAARDGAEIDVEFVD